MAMMPAINAYVLDIASCNNCEFNVKVPSREITLPNSQFRLSQTDGGTLISDEEYQSLLIKSTGTTEPNLPPHMSGDSFQNTSHITVKGAENTRIKNQGTQLVISGFATVDNPEVFCHGMPMGTLGLKEGKAIKKGNYFEETIQIPLFHQYHDDMELGKRDDPSNPYFEIVTIYRLK